MVWRLLGGHITVYTSLDSLENNEPASLTQDWKSPKTESWLFAYINRTLKPILNNLRKLEPSLLGDSLLWEVFFPASWQPSGLISRFLTIPSQSTKEDALLRRVYFTGLFFFFFKIAFQFFFFFFATVSTSDFKNPILSHPPTVINIFFRRCQ